MTRPAQQTLAHLRLLAGDRPGGRFLEVRYRHPQRGAGMRRLFIPAALVHLAAGRLTPLAHRHDVYVGVALRTTRDFGGAKATDGSHLLYIECDSPQALEHIERFAYPPTLLISSGTPGHVHAYWDLREPAGNAAAERANRQLALHLGGDLASVDIARILRPAGTLNHKHTPPRPVELICHRPNARYALSELTRGLRDPEPPIPQGSRFRDHNGRALNTLDARLRAIPATEYVRVLVGLKPDRTGKIACPFHDDHHPSLQLYDGGTWYCFGCRRGGSIYQFAAALWGISRHPGWQAEARRKLARAILAGR